MANATDPVSALGILNLGNGLVEIAALTSLVGSAAAQSLALGDKGPAGLVWATMTIFGMMSIVALFTASSTPGWLRDSVGVRGPKSDSVVGLSLDLNKSFKCRGRGEAASAIECEIQIVSSISHLDARCLSCLGGSWKGNEGFAVGARTSGGLCL
jgi:hypothetical protein